MHKMNKLIWVLLISLISTMLGFSQSTVINGSRTLSQSADGNTTLKLKRKTDSSPTGKQIDVTDAAGTTSVFSVDVNGAIIGTSVTAGVAGNGTETVGGSTVNQVVIQSATAGSTPSISAAGTDTNIGLNLAVKGSGTVQLGSANASVTSAGNETVNNLTVNGTCTGCGGSTASTWFQWGINPNGTLNLVSSANRIYLWAFYVHGSLTYSKIAFQVVAGDGGNSYDVGIYPYSSGASCSLRKHIGATTMGTTGYVEFSLSGGGSDTLTDGWWVFATTGAATTATLRYDGSNNFPQPFVPVSAGAGSDITGGGTTLPSSITCPTQTFSATAGTASPIWLALHN